MKRIRKKYKTPAWINQLSDGLVQLLFVFVVIVVAFLIMILLPREAIKDVPFEIFMVVSFLALTLLLGLAFSIIKLFKSKRKRKVSYMSIRALYNDLKAHVSDIVLKDEYAQITVQYNSDVLDVFAEERGYRTCLNSKADISCIKQCDIYDYVIEFVHERKNNLSELEIFDTDIKSIDDTGITYTDDFEREHYIIFSECAQDSDNGDTCVGNLDSSQRSIVFYTPELRIRVSFSAFLSCKHKDRLLSGTRAKRIDELCGKISSYGFSLKNSYIRG